MQGLLATLPNARRVVCYSDPGRSDKPGPDFEVTGRLTGNVLDDFGVPTEADYYLCGPVPFMRDVGVALAARGVTADRINTEIFGPSDSIAPGVVHPPKRAPHPPEGPPGTGPAISFSRSNLTASWDTAFTSLLELAEACDVPVRWACRAGVCHTCESGLVSGEVNYWPNPLEPPGLGDVLICCSQPRTDLVIDL